MTSQPLAPTRLLSVDEYLGDPASSLACHLAGAFGYADGGAVTGVFTATAPFAVELDLDALV